MMLADSFYKDLIDNMFDGVYFVDRDRIITYWNKGAERITGYSAQQAIGRSCRDNLLNHVTANGVQLCLNQCPLAACMEDGNSREAEVFLHHADGHRVPVIVRVAPLRDAQDMIVGAVETFVNNEAIVQTRQQVREWRNVALRDKLTGIGNREFLDGRLHAALAEFLHAHNSAGLLFIDIDHFKEFNDTFGHEVGDRVLKMVAETLRCNLRATDSVGRWGGEEFLIVLMDVDEPSLKKIAEKLRSLVECSSLDLDGKSLKVTISVGGTLLQTRDTIEKIISRSDSMLYKSKNAGRNCVTIG